MVPHARSSAGDCRRKRHKGSRVSGDQPQPRSGRQQEKYGQSGDADPASAGESEPAPAWPEIGCPASRNARLFDRAAGLPHAVSAYNWVYTMSGSVQGRGSASLMPSRSWCSFTTTVPDQCRIVSAASKAESRHQVLSPRRYLPRGTRLEGRLSVQGRSARRSLQQVNSRS